MKKPSPSLCAAVKLSGSNVARAVHWLQPTDILPRLVFPGSASDDLQARVREDLESVLAFFGQQYGIQANPTDFTIYIHKDADALIQAFKDDGAHIDAAAAAHIRAGAATAHVTAGGDIVIPQTHWLEGSPLTSDIAWVRYTLTHEYFHVLDLHLVDKDRGSISGLNPWRPLWLTEGAAKWAESDHQVFDGSNTWEVAREGLLLAITEDTPSLRSTEHRNAAWEYTLGWLAIDRLTREADIGRYVEFWRQLAPTEIGPHGRWASSPGWRTAFQEIFGRSVSSFYADFDAWQWEQAAVSGATANPGDDDARWIRGRVTDESGAPVTGALVGANRVEGGVLELRGRNAETGADGVFAVRAPRDGDYLIQVYFATDCALYYSDGKLLGGWEWQKAQTLTVAGSDVHGVNIRQPQNVCDQIRGQVVNIAGEPLAGVSITCGGGRFCSWPQQTASDGTFTVAVENSDDYALSLRLTDSCTIHYRSGESTLTLLHIGYGTQIGIADNGVNGLRLQVPSDLCRHRVGGSVEGIERFLSSSEEEVVVLLCRAVDTLCVTRRHLDRDRSFAVAVPMAGSYRLEYYLDGCYLYYSPTGLTGNAAEAMRFNAGERDVRIGHRRVLDTMCAYQIGGRLINAAGEPLAQVSISICQLVGDECASWLEGTTDADGSFAVTVPVVGAYRLSVDLNDCSIYYHSGGLTVRQTEASRINVTEAESPNLQLRVPEGICGAHQIRGSVTKADDGPLTDTPIFACREVDDRCEEWAGSRTNNDGSFAITVPADGRYQVFLDLEGCTIYFRAGGFTTSYSERSTARVAGRNARLSPRQIPEGMCARRIAGRFVDANGAPLAEKWIEVHGSNGSSNRVQTDANGHFEIRVSSDDAYQFGIQLRSEPYCWRSLEGRALGSWDNPVRVGRADVTGVELRLPGTIEELCG